MKTLAGINIQYPISRLILDGQKTIETRTYPIPAKYVGVEMAIIETPGSDGSFDARIVGLIQFSGCFKYKSKKEFYKDCHRHFVTDDMPWKWENKKPKWGWQISKVTVFKNPRKAPAKRGIVYTQCVALDGLR